MARARHPRRSSDGPSQRQLRVGELVRRALSDILMRGEVHDPALTATSITVTEVRASPDLRHATVFYAPLAATGDAEMKAVGMALRRAAGPLRSRLAREVRLKTAIELHFQPDTSFDEANHIDRLLRSDKVRQDLARPAGGESGED